jgi:cytochrome P450
MLTEKNEPIPFHVSDVGIVEEVTNLLFAGTDTTGNTLAYLFWELSHYPEWLLQMREELAQACGDQTNPAFISVDELPVLEAVVYELWRLWPAAPASLQRVTPEGGVVIDGVVVPGNVCSPSPPLTLCTSNLF